MTLNDCPEVREIYKDFNIKEFELIYTCGNKQSKVEYPEVFISNYEYKKESKEVLQKRKKNILTI